MFDTEQITELSLLFTVIEPFLLCNLKWVQQCAVQVGKRDAMGWVHGKATKRRKRESVYTLVGEKISAAKILWCVFVLRQISEEHSTSEG